jgi:hypothetical protein
MIKEHRYFAQIMICIHRQVSAGQEMLCEVVMQFDPDIDPMMTVTSQDTAIQRFRAIKETLIQMCTEDKWLEIFNMASRVTIHANLPFACSISDKSFSL